MPIRRPVRVGVALLGMLGLAGPAWGQAASPAGPATPDRSSGDRGAYEAFVPLLERDEPRPSFWGEASPPVGTEPAEAASETPVPPAPGDEQAAQAGSADHARH